MAVTRSFDRFCVRKTMQLAQALYEGVTLDGAPVGFITYVRTGGKPRCLETPRPSVPGQISKVFHLKVRSVWSATAPG